MQHTHLGCLLPFCICISHTLSLTESASVPSFPVPSLVLALYIPQVDFKSSAEIGAGPGSRGLWESRQVMLGTLVFF